MSVIKKSKTISKSKSRKHFNKSKSRKCGSKTRKMRGGGQFQVKPSKIGQGKMRSKKNWRGRTKSWFIAHLPGAQARIKRENEKARQIQAIYIEEQRKTRSTPQNLTHNHLDPNLGTPYADGGQSFLKMHNYYDPKLLAKQKELDNKFQQYKIYEKFRQNLENMNSQSQSNE